ncbi:MAG: hypothetical protein H0X38_00495 [Planctomycetes bacterium]|nr:hypothetical protein [Planctomycetota bacterium]
MTHLTGSIHAGVRGMSACLVALPLVLLLACLSQLRSEDLPAASASVAGYQTLLIDGWTVRVHDDLRRSQAEATAVALALLRSQLDGIVQVVPIQAVEKLRGITLWVNPEYPGVRPSAEYHPGADWLRSVNRNPLMVKGVEFTNVTIFAAEIRRMPNLVLHELAHGFHDLVLGFDQPEVMAQFERMKAGGTYDKVERSSGDGRPDTFEKAYAMTNHREYFAECTEAFFGRNDFFPFDRAQLHQHDPQMEQLLERVWTTGR